MKSLTTRQKFQIVDFLLSQRMQSYGYDYTSWQRIKKQRVRAKRALRKSNIHNLKFDTFNGRLTIDDNGQVDYVVGQSANEEITNLMRRMVNPDANYVC